MFHIFILVTTLLLIIVNIYYYYIKYGLKQEDVLAY